jgi:hypothetical protein
MLSEGEECCINRARVYAWMRSCTPMRHMCHMPSSSIHVRKGAINVPHAPA